MTMDPIQTLFDSWDEGEEENYPHSRRVLASEAEVAAFEASHDVVLPELAREFYRRVNGMTHAQWERDTNHFRVKFFSLQQVFAVEDPSNSPASNPRQGRFFAIASVGHFDPGPRGYGLVYGLELLRDRPASNRVMGVYKGRYSFPVADSFEEFLGIAATRPVDDSRLDPEYARGMEALAGANQASARSRGQRWWHFWKA